MIPDATQSLVQSFKPYALNYARVLAFNGAYNGPPSNIITIRTPEGQPGPIDMLDCYPMGSSGKWYFNRIPYILLQSGWYKYWS